MEYTRYADNFLGWRHEVSSMDTVHTLHISDIHFDSLHCDVELLKKHLDEIKRKNGHVYIYGDVFDVMGCYGDPRSKFQDVNPKYFDRGEYLNLVVEDAVNFFTPYVKNIRMISEGNHESEIRKRRDVDILSWFVRSLNDQGGNIAKGFYSGWNELIFENNTKTSALLTHYHHGKGGNAKRSKGILNAQLDTMENPDCDFVFRGHTHQKFHDPSNVKYRVNLTNKKISKKTTHYVQTGSYKDGTGMGIGGWEVQKGFMPSRLGGWFIDFNVLIKGGFIKVSPQVYEAY